MVDETNGKRVKRKNNLFVVYKRNLSGYNEKHNETDCVDKSLFVLLVAE
ncbi:hypothetical protein [Enterococcus songbeiensis]|nr:hypothetical protein [Enterococcus songbeiensis]